MGMQIHTYRAPGWIIPVLVLLALALLPFAMALALAVGAAALGATAIRYLFLPARGSPDSNHQRMMHGPGRIVSNAPAIDADFEVKDENEKK